jgi:hypothetical protein
MRKLLSAGLVVGFVACSSKAPTARTAPPAPSTFTPSGSVTSSGSPIETATIASIDGPNALKIGTTMASGSYQLAGLQPSGFTRHTMLQRRPTIRADLGAAADNIKVLFDALCCSGHTACQGLAYDVGDGEHHPPMNSLASIMTNSPGGAESRSEVGSAGDRRGDPRGVPLVLDQLAADRGVRAFNESVYGQELPPAASARIG